MTVRECVTLRFISTSLNSRRNWLSNYFQLANSELNLPKKLFAVSQSPSKIRSLDTTLTPPPSWQTPSFTFARMQSSMVAVSRVQTPYRHVDKNRCFTRTLSNQPLNTDAVAPSFSDMLVLTYQKKKRCYYNNKTPRFARLRKVSW